VNTVDENPTVWTCEFAHVEGHLQLVGALAEAEWP